MVILVMIDSQPRGPACRKALRSPQHPPPPIHPFLLTSHTPFSLVLLWPGTSGLRGSVLAVPSALRQQSSQILTSCWLFGLNVTSSEGLFETL